MILLHSQQLETKKAAGPKDIPVASSSGCSNHAQRHRSHALRHPQQSPIRLARNPSPIAPPAANSLRSQTVIDFTVLLPSCSTCCTSKNTIPTQFGVPSIAWNGPDLLSGPGCSSILNICPGHLGGTPELTSSFLSAALMMLLVAALTTLRRMMHFSFFRSAGVVM